MYCPEAFMNDVCGVLTRRIDGMWTGAGPSIAMLYT